MKDKPHFSTFRLTSGQFAWGLWEPVGAARAIIAVAHGFATDAEAKAGIDEFKAMVAMAPLDEPEVAQAQPGLFALVKGAA